jgi:hypothetical protein
VDCAADRCWPSTHGVSPCGSSTAGVATLLPAAGSASSSSPLPNHRPDDCLFRTAAAGRRGPSSASLCAKCRTSTPYTQRRGDISKRARPLDLQYPSDGTRRDCSRSLAEDPGIRWGTCSPAHRQNRCRPGSESRSVQWYRLQLYAIDMFVDCETGVLGSRHERFRAAWLHSIRPVPSCLKPDAVDHAVDRSPSLPRTGFVSVPARNASLAGLRLRTREIERPSSYSGTVRLELSSCEFTALV